MPEQATSARRSATGTHGIHGKNSWVAFRSQAHAHGPPAIGHLRPAGARAHHALHQGTAHLAFEVMAGLVLDQHERDAVAGDAGLERGQDTALDARPAADLLILLLEL